MMELVTPELSDMDFAEDDQETLPDPRDFQSETATAKTLIDTREVKQVNVDGP